MVRMQRVVSFQLSVFRKIRQLSVASDQPKEGKKTSTARQKTLHLIGVARWREAECTCRNLNEDGWEDVPNEVFTEWCIANESGRVRGQWAG